MNKQFLHMQKLAGLITESQYKKLLEDQSTVDRILDKISAKGLDSLTDEEKKYLDTEQKSQVPNLGTTEVYAQKPEGELYKIVNFPSMPSAQDVMFPCNRGNEETCEGTLEMTEMLKNNDFKKIINKIGSHYKNNWRADVDQNMYPFHGIDFSGNFSLPLDEVYAQVSGESMLTFVDTLNRFSTGFKSEEEWEIEDWKKL
jgi:hypothetical protein